MSNQLIIEIVQEMRRDHPPEHECFEMWKALTNLLSDIGSNPASPSIKEKASRVAQEYREAKKAARPKTCQEGAGPFVCGQSYQHRGPHEPCMSIETLMERLTDVVEGRNAFESKVHPSKDVLLKVGGNVTSALYYRLEDVAIAFHNGRFVILLRSTEIERS